MEHTSFYIDNRNAPAQRINHCVAGVEHHFSEAAIQLAFAMHLFEKGADHVQICPDGQHLRQHALKVSIEKNGFSQTSSKGSTECGGDYVRGGQLLTVFPSSGEGNVKAEIAGQIVFAECRGGIINTRNPGQTSRLRKGLCEVIGQLMSRELNAERHIAVVPDTDTTRKLASRMKHRAQGIGIEIALVTSDGKVHFQ